MASYLLRGLVYCRPTSLPWCPKQGSPLCGPMVRASTAATHTFDDVGLDMSLTQASGAGSHFLESANLPLELNSWRLCGPWRNAGPRE
eukprot:1484554-Amphidinium_carterae.1